MVRDLVSLTLAVHIKIPAAAVVPMLVATTIAIALLVKPFAFPLVHVFDGHERHRSAMDLEHLSFIGPAIVLLAVTLVLGLRRAPAR